MLNYRRLKASIVCGIIIIFAVGCRTPEILSPSGDSTINAGDSITFAAQYYPNAIYKWTFDGGAKDVLGQNPTVQFNKAGVYYACLTVVYEDLDSGIAALKITVNGPSFDFLIISPGGDITINNGDSISFSAESYPNAIYKWTFDGGADDVSVQNPTVRFDRAGVYDVCLTVLFGDGNSGVASRQVTVNGPTFGPVITTPSGDITIDAGDSISFLAESYPNATYKWTFDGGAKDALGQNPTVQFNKAGVYSACLTVVYEDLESGIDSLVVTVNGPSYGEALVEKTGQTTCYDESNAEISCSGTGQDGETQKGVAFPNPRFTDNGDGTVTDNLTGLVWLKNANCIQTNYPGFDADNTAGDGRVLWQHALDFVSGINAGTYSNCGGGFTDWRLPNVKELQSLVHYGYYDPALPNTVGTGHWTSGDPFTNVQSDDYWSATSNIGSPSNGWYVVMYYGYVRQVNKNNYNYVWPVRGGDSR